MLGHAAQNEFAESRVTIGAGNNDAGTDVGGDAVQLSHRIAVLVLLRREFGSRNAVT